MAEKSDERYDPKEAQRRFEAALRGAKLVGHKPQSEMKLGKATPKRSKTKKSPTVKPSFTVCLP